MLLSRSRSRQERTESRDGGLRSQRDSVDVTLHTGSDVQQVCASPIATGLVPPITVTVIAPDGRSKTARIEIETVAAVELGRIEISALRLGDDAGDKPGPNSSCFANSAASSRKNWSRSRGANVGGRDHRGEFGIRKARAWCVLTSRDFGASPQPLRRRQAGSGCQRLTPASSIRCSSKAAARYPRCGSDFIEGRSNVADVAWWWLPWRQAQGALLRTGCAERRNIEP